jgi:RNA polymerase sigma-70 factor (sigma-E family)
VSANVDGGGLDVEDVDAAGSADATDAEVRGSTAPDLLVVTTFEDVYRTDYDRMVRVAYMLSGSNEVAEDIVQDAFVQLYSRFDRLADPVPYLYRTVVNGCRLRHRRQRVVERLRHLTTRSDQTTEQSSAIDGTWSALDRLPPRRRAVVVLRYYADLPLAEIAEVLGCKIGTVKSMLHRALAELKEVVTR